MESSSLTRWQTLFLCDFEELLGPAKTNLFPSTKVTSVNLTQIFALSAKKLACPPTKFTKEPKKIVDCIICKKYPAFSKLNWIKIKFSCLNAKICQNVTLLTLVYFQEFLRFLFQFPLFSTFILPEFLTGEIRNRFERFFAWVGPRLFKSPSLLIHFRNQMGVQLSEIYYLLAGVPLAFAGLK